MRQPIAWTRHLPEAVDDRGMGEAVVRNGAADGRREPEPRRDGIRKGIAQEGRGIVVHGFAVSVSTSELEAVAQSLLDIKLDGLISGVGIPLDPPDKSVVFVDPQVLLAAGVIGVGGGRPQELSRRELRREDIVEIVASYDHMDAMGAYITHRRRQAGGDLALEVDIPLLDVISPRIGIDIGAVEVANLLRRRAIRVCLQCEVRVCTPRGVRGDANRSSERLGIVNFGREEKRRPVLTETQVSRQRQNVKDGEAATNGRLPISLGIPSKTDSRLKIKSGGVRVERRLARATRLSKDVGEGKIGRPAVGQWVGDIP